MKKPKMIIFDYGHTLLYEPGHDLLRGEEALFRYVIKNKKGLTPKEINEFSHELYLKTRCVRDMGYEIHQWQFQRLVYEYLGIEFSISPAEAEKVFWDNVTAGALMPNADKMIHYINERGIRSGVISNIGWSGSVLSERIHRLLPHNRFEFIIASSEYLVRKPNPMLFELALSKADLDATEVWFCGDNVKADIKGSAAVGMFPVWYDNRDIENPWVNPEENVAPDFEHLHIHDWSELISILERLE